MPILYFFEVARCRFCIFRKPKLLQDRNSKFWQGRFLHFRPISTQNFKFVGSIYRFLPRISLNTRKFCSPNFSSTDNLVNQGRGPDPFLELDVSGKMVSVSTQESSDSCGIWFVTAVMAEDRTCDVLNR